MFEKWSKVSPLYGNKRALHTQGLAAGVKSWGKFPEGNFPQWEMPNFGNYFIMPFSPFQ